MTLLTATAETGGLLHLLLIVAIACVVAWAIFALIKWAGWTIPQPIWIILTALFCIFVIVKLFQIFGMLM